MSKEKEDLTYYHQDIDDDLESPIERYPRSKIPLLPIIILFFIFILSGVLTKQQKVEPLEQAPSSHNSKQNNPSSNQQAKRDRVNLHQLIVRDEVIQIAEKVYALDKEVINEVVNGMTPIMLAASQGNVEIIDLLFTQGANPNKRGSAQRTALQYAVEKNHIEVAQRLLDYGADIDAYDNGRLTPLIMAADRGYTELALLLLDEGADPDIQHSQGWTALIDAARNGDVRLVNALLAAGADTTISMKNGMKARDMAKQNGHKNIVNILTR